VPRLLSNDLLGKQIRRIRQQLGLSQAQLAKALGAPGRQSDVSKWEQGKGAPSEETLERLASLAGEDFSVFERQQPNPPRQDEEPSPDLVRALAHIEGLAIEEPLKTWRLEALAAVYRADALRQAEQAATLRASAIREAEAASAERARAVRSAEDGELARARAAGQRFDTGLPREREKLVPPPGEIGGGERTG
jgi:transcriptional regulator with XRE-family HTH domain